VSDLRSRPLRHALKQAAVTGTTGSLLLGVSVLGLAAPGAAPVTAAPSTSSTTSTTSTTTAPVRTATVTIHTEQVASKSKRKRVNVPRMMKTAKSLKGRPYRYGAAGPRAFDCSGYTMYVLKKQNYKIPRTAAQQYTRTVKVAKKRARVGDLVFFYGRGGIYHVGIYAGKGKMWAAPHSGARVRLQKIWGSNWKVGRLR
jgi:cell wall-associated NlpC family hydrolase